MAFFTCDDLTPDLCELKEEQGQVEVNGIQVTYFKYTSADATHESEDIIPIIAIHGGPSYTHNYMLPLKQQACHGRPTVFYDQAGCGKSRPVPGNFSLDDYPWLLDPLYYSTVELPAILKHLGWEDFHIVANSWGTMLAQLYALEAKDETRKHLKSMVLSGPLSDSQAYVKAQWDQDDGSVGSLPPFIQKRIHAFQKENAFDSAEYAAVNDACTGKFTIRTVPFPDCWLDSEDQVNMDIYTAMQGPNEFGMSGVLADFNVTGRLKEVEVPVLLSHGKYDTMRPSIVYAMKEALPNAETLFLTKSGHVSMIDEPGPMNAAVADFYDRVEAPSRARGSMQLLGQMTSGLQQHLQAQPSAGAVPFSTLLLSTLLALMAGYVMGLYREHRNNSRQHYTTISE